MPTAEQIRKSSGAVDDAFDRHTPVVGGEENEIAAVHRLPQAVGQVVAAPIGPRHPGRAGADPDEFVDEGQRPDGVVAGDVGGDVVEDGDGPRPLVPAYAGIAADRSGASAMAAYLARSRRSAASPPLPQRNAAQEVGGETA